LCLSLWVSVDPRVSLLWILVLFVAGAMLLGVGARAEKSAAARAG
jgi:hypothetical protein